jgi:hypothetical protein
MVMGFPPFTWRNSAGSVKASTQEDNGIDRENYSVLYAISGGVASEDALECGFEDTVRDIILA